MSGKKASKTTMAQINTEQEAPLYQINARIPEALHRELKSRCGLVGLTIQEALTAAIRQYLADKEK